ncbi:hypothetical protein GCM10027286_08570 [Virgibacillus ainsalahensis]
MIACSVNQVGKMYGGDSIFEDITVEIQEKDRVGLVGRNGSGKTTLLQLLAGKESPDSGQIHWKKGYNIGYLTQIPDVGHKETAKDVLMTAFSDPLEIEAKMLKLELEMSKETKDIKLQRLIREYGNLQDDFTGKGGYEMEASIAKIANGLAIHDLLDNQFSTLSGGEKTKVGLARILLETPVIIKGKRA